MRRLMVLLFVPGAHFPMRPALSWAHCSHSLTEHIRKLNTITAVCHLWIHRLGP